VVKRFPLAGPDERAAVEQIETERPRLMALSHPNLARVLDCVVIGPASDGEPAELLMVQQHVEGKSLDQLYATGQRLRRPEVLVIALDAARALQTIHDAGLVHGELRPSNLVLSPSGKVFLVDVGGPLHRLPGRRGKRGFDPPDARLSPAGDVYALGATLAFLLTRRDPATLLVDGRVQWRSGAKVSDPFAAILDRMLEPDPEQRFPRGRELATALARVELPLSWRASGLRWWLTAGIAAGTIAAAASVALFVRHGRGGPSPPPVVAVPARPPAPPAPPPATAPATGGPGLVVPPRVPTAASLEALGAALASGTLRNETTLTIPGAAVWASAAATDAWRSLLASSEIAGIEELRIEARLTRATVADLLATQGLRSLRSLSLNHSGVADEGVVALAASPLARQLETLALVDEDLGEPAARALAGSTRLLRLRELRLPRNHLGEGGLSELARSQALRSLETLDLGGNGIGPAAGPPLAQALEGGGLPALRKLILVDNTVPADAVAAVRRLFTYEVRAGDVRTTGGRPADKADPADAAAAVLPEPPPSAQASAPAPEPHALPRP
jgi:hypothetical protein